VTVSTRIPYVSLLITAFLLNGLISTHLLADEHSDTDNLQLGIHQVGSWHAASDSELILKDHQNNQYQVTLKPPCTGLGEAKSIAFISHGSSSLDRSSSVVLASGKRCPFESFHHQKTK